MAVLRLHIHYSLSGFELPLLLSTLLSFLSIFFFVLPNISCIYPIADVVGMHIVFEYQYDAV